jgi:hypothetical protein
MMSHRNGTVTFWNNVDQLVSSAIVIRAVCLLGWHRIGSSQPATEFATPVIVRFYQPVRSGQIY